MQHTEISPNFLVWKFCEEGLSVLHSKSQILAITKKKNYAKVDLILLDFSTLFQIVSPSSVLRWMSKFLRCKKYILVNFKLLFHWIVQLFNLFVDTKVVLLEVFCKKGFLKHFAKFTGKHFCGNLYFNKVAGLTLFNNSFFLGSPYLGWFANRSKVLMRQPMRFVVPKLDTIFINNTFAIITGSVMGVA